MILNSQESLVNSSGDLMADGDGNERHWTMQSGPTKERKKQLLLEDSQRAEMSDE